VEPKLRRYQVMSFVVGTMLLIFCAFIILRHGFGVAATAEMIVAQIHGVLYMVYLVTVGQVAFHYKLAPKRIAVMVCSGFIPGLAFVVEHRVIAELREPVLAS
jgi:integral membrane protein